MVKGGWAEFRAALDEAGFRPSKRFGQNFLLDDNMACAIADDAGIEPGEFVLEIGPGCGFLSIHLAPRAGRLLCVEIDTRLAPVAAKFLSGFEHAEVLIGDVLANKSSLNPEVLQRIPGDSGWVLCANLPYSISGPLLATIAQLERPPRRVCCLVQKEVAERLAAEPGSGTWGPLTASFQESYVVQMGRSVPPQLFWPRPKVDSAVFVADLRESLPQVDLRRARVGFYRRLLQRRRQGLRRVLADLSGGAAADAALAEAGLDPKRRAETLTMDELRGLHGCWESTEGQ